MWLGELHFSRGFSILADPLMVLAAAAQRTSRIRLGTAVTLLPLHNPVKIAEEAAICDILSDGRLEFGAAAAPRRCIMTATTSRRRRAASASTRRSISSSASGRTRSFSFEGKYFRARDLTVVPRPLQKPYPPLRIAANSPDTFPFAARRHFPIFATPMINPPTSSWRASAVYRAGLGGARR